jgi:NAD-dependent DNA ligase
LHNIQYIRDLDLEIGCKVEIIRSGEIIPRVVRRID